MKSYKDFVTGQFPKIICIGLNYVKHIKEMGGPQVPKEPVVFIKPWSSIAYNPKTVNLSMAKVHKIDHEVQLGVFFNKGGKNIKEEDVAKHIGGYFLAIDFSDRAMQTRDRPKGFPWTLWKGQDDFCPISDLFSIEDPYSLELELFVNGNLRQKQFTSEMHFNINALISYTSKYMTINEGDLLLTGTPKGVGPVEQGDHVEAFLKLKDKKLATLDFTVQKDI